jgi:hypothetical protein
MQNANEHASTYAELERNAIAEEPDLDRINLLIDLIKVPLGGCRHAWGQMDASGRPSWTTTSSRS